MPKKTKEAEEIPVKDTKKDAKKIATKVATKNTKNADTSSASKSKPSGTKTTKAKKTTENLEVSKVEKDSKNKSTKLKETKSVKSTKSDATKTTKKSKVSKATELEPTKTPVSKTTNIIEKPETKASKKTSSIKVSKIAEDTKSTKIADTNKPKTSKDTKSSRVAKTDKPKTSKDTKPSKVAKTNKLKTTNQSKPAKVAKQKTSKTKASKTGLVSVIEYYDLPYRYSQTIVKILAQTPKMLFVYWDISDDDRKNFEEQYGNDFFNATKPVLIIHNETMNYSFEIEINDFANSWYLHINDAYCKYVIELGRRPYTRTPSINTDYIYVSSSNEMTSPNNHILFEKFNPNVTYKNTKNGQFSKRDFGSLASYKNMQAIYNIYDLYKTIYKDDLFCEITNEDLTNPSSLSSSSFK